MFFECSAVLWSVPAAIILLCEIFVPYRRKLFFSMFLAAISCVVISSFVHDLFMQSVFFLVFCVMIYMLFSALMYIARSKKHKDYIDVIVLCDIQRGGYGTVYTGYGNYIIKNPHDKRLAKGEVIRMEKKELFEVSAREEKVENV